MRDILEAVADGTLSPEQAEGKLAGYVTTDAGRFDAARKQRRGIPEAILAEGKTTAQLCRLVDAALETTDRALLTRLSETQCEALEAHLADAWPTADAERRSSALRITTPTFEQPSLSARITVVTAGAVDERVADEAHLVCTDAGATVDRIDDIGVAALDRTLDQVERIREADVVIVAAGREGALPTVLAGLVDSPVIGLPVSSGYGHGGDGEAALAGLLQSCTVLSVVNVDAGFVAGAQATLIARTLDMARN